MIQRAKLKESCRPALRRPARPAGPRASLAARRGSALFGNKEVRNMLGVRAARAALAAERPVAAAAVRLGLRAARGGGVTGVLAATSASPRRPQLFLRNYRETAAARGYRRFDSIRTARCAAARRHAYCCHWRGKLGWRPSRAAPTAHRPELLRVGLLVVLGGAWRGGAEPHCTRTHSHPHVAPTLPRPVPVAATPARTARTKGK